MVFLIFISIMLPFSVLDYAKKTINVYSIGKYMFLCCLLFFIFIAGGRYYPGTGDWDYYRSAFEASGRIGNIRLQGFFEFGFELLVNVIKTFSNQYVFFFVTYEIIVCIFLYQNIKKYIGYPISACCLYLPLLFMPMDLIQIRSLLAVQIFVFSIQFIKERKMMPYFLCIFCASTIHISSIILFPLYFILNRRFKNITIYLVVIVGLLSAFLGFDIFMPIMGLVSPFMGEYIQTKVNAYLFSGINVSRSIGFIHLEFFVFFPLIMMYRKRLEKCDKYANIFLNIYIFYGITILYLWKMSVFSGRLKFFFIASIIYFIPRLIAVNKKSFIMVFLCYFGYVLATIAYLLTGSNTGNFLLTYRNYFFL